MYVSREGAVAHDPKGQHEEHGDADAGVRDGLPAPPGGRAQRLIDQETVMVKDVGGGQNTDGLDSRHLGKLPRTA